MCSHGVCWKEAWSVLREGGIRSEERDLSTRAKRIRMKTVRRTRRKKE